MSSTETFSLGRGGRLSPQTRSTKLVFTPTNEAPPFFLIFSSSLRASAALSETNDRREVQLPILRAVMTVGSTPTVLFPSDCSADLHQISSPLTDTMLRCTILAK